MINFFLKIIRKFLIILTNNKLRNTNNLIISIIYFIEKIIISLRFLFPNILFNNIYFDILNFRSEYYFIQGNYNFSKQIFNDIVTKDIIYAINHADELSLDYRYLTSFGELAAQIDIFVKFNILNKKSIYNKKKYNDKFICYYKYKDCSNLSLIKLWSKYIDFRNLKSLPKNKKIFFINSRWLPTVVTKKKIIFEPYSSVYPIVQKEWEKKNKRGLIKITEQIRQRTQKYFLYNYKVNIEKEKIVTTHINNFYRKNFDFHKIRIVKNVSTYLKTFNYLSSIGYRNIILSPKKSKTLSKKFINITESAPSYISIFLLAKCNFFIGSASGPHMVPYIFNKNSIWTNIIPFESTPPLKKDIYILKKCFLGEKLLLNELFRSLLIQHSTNYYNLKGINVIDNCENEIFNAVLEFLNKKKQNTFLQMEFNKIRKNQLPYKLDINSNISSYFIKKNFEKFIKNQL
jgi:putative glycosyltransferase (TIGR04372 family)